MKNILSIDIINGIDKYEINETKSKENIRKIMDRLLRDIRAYLTKVGIGIQSNIKYEERVIEIVVNERFNKALELMRKISTIYEDNEVKNYNYGGEIAFFTYRTGITRINIVLINGERIQNVFSMPLLDFIKIKDNIFCDIYNNINVNLSYILAFTEALKTIKIPSVSNVSSIHKNITDKYYGYRTVPKEFSHNISGIDNIGENIITKAVSKVLSYPQAIAQNFVDFQGLVLGSLAKGIDIMVKVIIVGVVAFIIIKVVPSVVNGITDIYDRISESSYRRRIERTKETQALIPEF